MRVTVVVWLMCQLSLAQEEDTAIVSDTTDDLWFLTEGESEQVSVEMKEAALEEGSRGEGEAPLEDDDGGGKEEKTDREVCVCSKFDCLSFHSFVETRYGIQILLVKQDVNKISNYTVFNGRTFGDLSGATHADNNKNKKNVLAK